MDDRRKTKAKPKETTEQLMARKVKEVMAPTRDVVARVKDWTVVAAGSATFLAMVVAFIRYGGGLLDSGPLPVPSRSEVIAVAMALKEAKDSQNLTNQNLTTQLENQGALTRGLLDDRKREAADQLARQLSNQQSALDVAKTIYDKDPSLANQKVVEALAMRLMELQRQIKDQSPPK